LVITTQLLLFYTYFAAIQMCSEGEKWKDGEKERRGEI
jgi:hypothetical protein